MAGWGFLTNHGRVLLCIAHDPGVRLRDMAARLGITERTAYGIVTDLAEAGYIIKDKDGRRNRYQIQAHLPLPDPTGRERTVGEIVALLAGEDQLGTELSPADSAGLSSLRSSQVIPRSRRTIFAVLSISSGVPILPVG